jgi:hypothetical protein
MRRELLAVPALIAVVALYYGIPRQETASPDTQIDPVSWMAPAWIDALGGDALNGQETGPDPASFAKLTDVPAKEAPTIAALAIDVAVADASGVGRASFGTYFARNHTPVTVSTSTSLCENVSVLAVSSYMLPVRPEGSAVKSLVLWRGNCPYPPRSLTPVGVEPMYLSALYLMAAETYPYKTPDEFIRRYKGWVPVRPLEIPGSAAAVALESPPPASWELSRIATCSAPNITLRSEVAAAFSLLCAEAQAAQLPLYAIDGLRSAADQADRFKSAVTEFGSERAARGRVAYSDGSYCSSLHCSGEAVDIAPNAAVVEWMHATTGCLDSLGFRLPPCPAEARPISRIARYGFSAPNPTYPYHLEYILGTLSADADLYGDCTPGPVGSPDQVRLIFLCRLLESGIKRSEVERVQAEASAIAECSSGFDSGFVVFSGKFVSAPNPATGAPDDRTGIFALSAEFARRWVLDGEDSRPTAVLNIDAAARFYVEERSWGRWGWDAFACATADDGVVTTPVVKR